MHEYVLCGEELGDGSFLISSLVKTLLREYCYVFSRIYRKLWTSVRVDWKKKKKDVKGELLDEWNPARKVDRCICKWLLYLLQKIHTMELATI